MVEMCKLCGKDVLSRGGVDPEGIDFLNVKRGLCCLCFLKSTACTRGENLGYSLYVSKLIYGQWNLRCYSDDYGTNRCIWNNTDATTISISRTKRTKPEDSMIRGEIKPYKLAIP